MAMLACIRPTLLWIPTASGRPVTFAYPCAIATANQAVVQTPVTGTGNERDVGQVETAQQLGQRVAAPLHRDIAAFDTFGVFCPHVGPPTATTLGMTTLGDQRRRRPVAARGFCLTERGAE